MDLFPTNRGNRRFHPPFFDSDWLNSFGLSMSAKTDIRETKDEYILEAELPGFSKENINIDYNNDVLTISAKEEFEAEEKDSESGTYLRRERSTESFSRQFIFQDIKPDEITANYTDGLLTIILPKENSGKSHSRRIEIE